MKKTLAALKFLAVNLWFAFIYFIFYIVNKYYAESFLEWKHWLFLAAAGLVLFFLFGFINAKRDGIDLKILALGLLILPLILTGYEFLSNQYAYVEGGSIVREGTKIYFLPEGESAEGKDVLFQQDLVVPRFDYVKKQMPEGMIKYFKKVSFLKAMASVEKYLLLNASGAAAFFLIFYGLGAAVFFRKRKLDSADRVLAFFLGAGLITFPIFILGALKLYSAGSFLIVAALLIAIGRKQIFEFIKFIFREKLKFEKSERTSLAIFSVLYLLFGMLMIDIIRVIPIAWDDANLYMRGAKLFAELNEFTFGVGPTSWTLLQSAAWLFYDNPELSLTLLFATVLTGMWAFHLIAEKFLSRRNAFVADVFFLTIPLLTFFSVLDTKTELPLLFTGGAAFLAWLKWRENKEKKYLIICSILLGFAVSIKITSIIFAAVMILATIYIETSFIYLPAALYCWILAYFALSDQMQTLNAFEISSGPLGYILLSAGIILSGLSLYKEKCHKHLKKFSPAAYMVIAMILMLLPWVILNATHAIKVLTDLGARDTFSAFSDSLFGLKKFADFLPGYYVPAGQCPAGDFALIADYKRYTGNGNGLKALLLFPFSATMTVDLKTFISDITPVFLSILPLWLLFPKKLFGSNKKILFLFLTAFAYSILWGLTSSGVMWYGILMLIPGSILVIYTLNQKEKWWKYPLVFFIGFTLLANTFVRAKMFAELFHLSYAFGIKSEKEIIEDFHPGLPDVADALVKYRKEHEKIKIYRVGSQVKFFLPFPDEVIMDDDYLDQYTCIAQGKSSDEIKLAFEKSGFTHVFINTNAGLGDVTYGETYKEKIDQLNLFLTGSGWKLLYDDHNIQLYEIPTQ